MTHRPGGGRDPEMDHAYFLYHSIGLYPGKAADMGAAFSAFAELWSAPDDSQWPRALAAREEYLALWRDLIGAPDGSLTSAENVTTGLFSVVGGIADRLRGRTVLVGADCFPSLHFLLAGLADRLGFTLRTVPLRPGEAWVREEDLIDAWGRDVALALLTFVTSTASYRCDLDALVAHGHDMGSLVAVDLTQGVGILPFSVCGDARRHRRVDEPQVALRHAGGGDRADAPGASGRDDARASGVVQPAEPVLLGPRRLRLCARRPAARPRHAVGARLRWLGARASLAPRGAGGRASGAEPAARGMDHGRGAGPRACARLARGRRAAGRVGDDAACRGHGRRRRWSPACGRSASMPTAGGASCACRRGS